MKHLRKMSLAFKCTLLFSSAMVVMQPASAEILRITKGSIADISEPVISQCNTLGYVSYVSAKFVVTTTSGHKFDLGFPYVGTSLGCSGAIENAQELMGDLAISIQEINEGDLKVYNERARTNNPYCSQATVKRCTQYVMDVYTTSSLQTSDWKVKEIEVSCR